MRMEMSVKEELQDRLRLVYNLNERVEELQRQRDFLIKESRVSYTDFSRAYAKYELERRRS